MFDKFLSSFSTKTAAARRKGRPARCNSPARRLRMEALEARLALSAVPAVTLTVTSNADSGPGSLRAAVTNAASGDTINFAPTVKAIKLTTATLSITKSLDIEGPGVTISGNNAFRVFDISGTVTVTLAGLTITQGKVGVTQPFGVDGGGGILNQAGATLNLNQCVLTNNVAFLSLLPGDTPGAVYGDVGGGGLLNNGGTVNLNGTTVEFNTAQGGTSATAIGGSTGGGIDNFEGTLNVTDSNIVSNQAISVTLKGQTYTSFALGGGIASYGSNTAAATVNITTSIIANNVASGVAGANGNGVVINGGGIVNYDLQPASPSTSPYPYAPTMTISNSTISGNQADGGANGTTGVGAAIGGGVFNDLAGLSITNSTLLDNVAKGGSGSTPSVGTNPEEFEATGAGQGGGIVNYQGSAFVSGCALIGNKAVGGTTTSGPGAIATGGGISNWGSTVTTPAGPSGTIDVTESTFIDNEAIAGQGAKAAAGYGVNAPWGFAVGGAVDDSFFGIATLDTCTLIGNEAIGSSGVKGGTGFGGGVSVGFSTFYGATDASSFQLTNSTLQGNIAQGGKGSATGGNGLGGGLAINPGSNTYTSNSMIDQNQALGGIKGGQGIGGGVYNNGAFTDHALTTAIDFNFATTSNFNVFGPVSS